MGQSPGRGPALSPGWLEHSKAQGQVRWRSSGDHRLCSTRHPDNSVLCFRHQSRTVRMVKLVVGLVVTLAALVESNPERADKAGFR